MMTPPKKTVPAIYCIDDSGTYLLNKQAVVQFIEKYIRRIFETDKNKLFMRFKKDISTNYKILFHFLVRPLFKKALLL